MRGISALKPALEVDPLEAAVPVPVRGVMLLVEEGQTDETTLSRPS